jgi:hypothetical protein
MHTECYQAFLCFVNTSITVLLFASDIHGGLEKLTQNVRGQLLGTINPEEASIK